MTNPDQKNATGKDAARVELLPPSFTMRVGNRRLTMCWRPRKPVSTLLMGLLRRSWCAMFGKTLRISMMAATICAAWNVPSMAAAPPPNTLPTGGVITSGSATITQNGNTLNINQSTNQAIANFTTFSIGSNAVVDINQPNAAAAFLARVTSSDPSLIYGLLKSNGTVALINQNGIMVGPGGVVDVARFIASTLAISDSDFLAGRLTFNAGATAGNVENQGTIKTSSGGSVYLIGANVTNSGVIQSPNGEILLAAGQTVQLVDTGTPGVSVNVTGTTGSVTNLGSITAEAGRIGIAAGLINNSGIINASSVVSDGGRIFLRASQNLTTTASSSITADGATKGGSVVLYSDKVAYIDGSVSAQGAPGQGGYVETSGKTSLDVIKLPTVGSGGEWYIDPYDLEVVASGGTATSNVSGVITSVGSSAKIEASTVAGMLNSGVSVTLVTGAGGAADGGNITVSSAINKTGGSAASLTLNANNSIAIKADITSTSGALNLNLNSNLSGITGDHTVNVSGALVRLNGGVINVNDGSGNSGNGNIAINNGAKIDLNDSGTLNAGTLTVATGGTLSSVVNAGVNLLGDLNNSGTVALNGSTLNVRTLTNSGTVSVVDGTLSATDKITNAGAFTIGNSTINTVNGFINSLGATLNLNTYASFSNAGILQNTGTMNVIGSITTNGAVINDAMGVINLGGDQGFVTINGTGGWTNNGAILLNGTSRTVQMTNAAGLTNTNTGSVTLGGGNTLYLTSMDNSGNLVIGSGATLNGTTLSNDGTTTLNGGSMVFNTITNNLGGNIAGTGSISASGQFTNNGVLSPGGIGTVGALGISGNFTQGVTGVLNIDVASDTSYDVLTINAPTVGLGGTLQSNFLGSYVPTLTTRLSPIVFTNNNAAGSSYFRHVLGNVIGTGNDMQMLKVDYKGALALVMSGSEDLTYSGNSGSYWGTALSWTGGVLPTAIDNVIVAAGKTLSQASGDGVDTVKSITLNNGSSLSIGSGNTVNVGNISSTGYSSITIVGTATEGGGGASASNAAVLNVSGSARVSSLTLSDGGTLNGGSSSILNVTDNFTQSGGSIVSFGDVALNQANGDLSVGSITARNLALESEGGAITQQDTSLHVTKQLLTSSVTGTTLTSSNNRIAAFAGNNRGIHDIVLVNNLELADTSAFTINGVTNANGSININNTGATRTAAMGNAADFLTTMPRATDDTTAVPTVAQRLATLGIVSNGTISAGMLLHSVTIAAHSPLTIGSGGITAAGGISLAAGIAHSGLSNDSLVVNGQLVSNGGVISLIGGGSLNVNANITGVYIPDPLPSPQPIYGPGVMLNGVLVGSALASNTSTTTQLTPSPDTTSQLDRTVNNSQPTTTVTPTTTNPVTDNTQTTGGTPGTFGGDEPESSTPGSSSGSSKKAPEVKKMYCS